MKYLLYLILKQNSLNRLTKVEFICPSNLREDAEQTCKALYGVTDVRQLTRLWN